MFQYYPLMIWSTTSYPPIIVPFISMSLFSSWVDLFHPQIIEDHPSHCLSPSDGISSNDTGGGSLGKLRAFPATEPREGDAGDAAVALPKAPGGLRRSG